MTTTALERLLRRSGGTAAGSDRCDLCAVEIADLHAHLLDTEEERLCCTCRACALLFAEDVKQRYRIVPQQRVRLPALRTDTLGVPVGLAFFVPRTHGGVDAHYPSPAGATRWEVDPAAWQALVAPVPRLRDMEPDVEALLVNTARGCDERWLVPIDDCYRLVALVRREWKGLSGGSSVWPRVREFFDGLDAARSRGH